VVLKSPLEHITCIKGTLGFVSGHQIITSLTFVSNTNIYGPYGLSKGEEFTSSGCGKIVGLFGQAGSTCINQLGVFSTTLETISPNIEGSWGGNGGYAFSDGRGEIIEIKIRYNNDQVISLQAIYDQNGAHFPASIHGGDHGGKCETVPTLS